MEVNCCKRWRFDNKGVHNMQVHDNISSFCRTIKQSYVKPMICIAHFSLCAVASSRSSPVYHSPRRVRQLFLVCMWMLSMTIMSLITVLKFTCTHQILNVLWTKYTCVQSQPYFTTKKVRKAECLTVYVPEWINKMGVTQIRHLLTALTVSVCRAFHYNDVIMSVMASQITSLRIVCAN